LTALRIEKILAPAANDRTGEFQPLPLSLLAGGEEVPFEVYVKVKAKAHPEALFLQCCSRGEVFPGHWQSQMQQLRLSRIYVRQAPGEEILPYLLHNLKGGLTRKNWGNRKKAVLICEVALFWLRHLFTLEVEQISEQMDAGLNLIECLGEIIKRENNPVSLALGLWRQGDLYAHGLHNCLLGLAFARFLGWKEKDARAFGLTALVHDVGMTMVPKSIREKATPLTAAERRLIGNHPHAGFAILRNSPLFRWEALLTVLQHHENGDGSGYPEKLQKRQIHPWARILRILDSFEAMSSKRRWRAARSPKEALWTMRRDWERNQVYDPAYLSLLLNFWQGAGYMA